MTFKEKIALLKQEKLENLDLSWKKIGLANVQVLALALKGNKSLKTLDLSGNNIGPTGAQYLALALKENKSLRTLELSKNSIGDAGAQYLADTLKHNNSLITLELYGNGIGPTGAKHLSDAVKNNTSLTLLSFNECEIGSCGMNETAQHPDLVANLKDLWQDVGCENYFTLQKYLERNENIKEHYTTARQALKALQHFMITRLTTTDFSAPEKNLSTFKTACNTIKVLHNNTSLLRELQIAYQLRKLKIVYDKICVACQALKALHPFTLTPLTTKAELVTLEKNISIFTKAFNDIQALLENTSQLLHELQSTYHKTCVKMALINNNPEQAKHYYVLLSEREQKATDILDAFAQHFFIHQPSDKKQHTLQWKFILSHFLTTDKSQFPPQEKNKIIKYALVNLLLNDKTLNRMYNTTFLNIKQAVIESKQYTSHFSTDNPLSLSEEGLAKQQLLTLAQKQGLVGKLLELLLPGTVTSPKSLLNHSSTFFTGPVNTPPCTQKETPRSNAPTITGR